MQSDKKSEFVQQSQNGWSKIKNNKCNITIPFKAKLKLMTPTNTNLIQKNLQEFVEITIDLKVKYKYNKLKELVCKS